MKAARENAKRAGRGSSRFIFSRERLRICIIRKIWNLSLQIRRMESASEEKEDLPELYTQIGQAYAGLDSWSLYMIYQL